jgi:hypothetical protein
VLGFAGSKVTSTRRKIEDLPKGDGENQGARVRVFISGLNTQGILLSGGVYSGGRLGTGARGRDSWKTENNLGTTCEMVSRAQRTRASSRQGARLPRVYRLQLLEAGA